MISEAQRTAVSIDEAAQRWGVSPFTIRRFIARGLLRTFNVGARKLVPVSEIARVERDGLGSPKAKIVDQILRGNPAEKQIGA
jgi:Helix-turn-helix domain